MSAYKAISLKKQQMSKYNLCKHQFRGNLKIKKKGSLELKLIYLKRICWVFWIINHCQNCWRLFPLFDLLERLVCWVNFFASKEKKIRKFCTFVQMDCFLIQVGMEILYGIGFSIQNLRFKIQKNQVKTLSMNENCSRDTL